MFSVLISFAIALVGTLAFVPLAKRIAVKVKLVDIPDNKRKLHSTPIPLVGGISAFLVAFLAIVTCFLIAFSTGEITQLEEGDILQLWGLFAAALLLLVVGIVDDRFGMRGRQKLVGQIVVATLLIMFGYSFDSVEFFGFKLQLGHFALLVMYAWILGGINSVNLLDGADGFATSLGILMSAGLCVMSLFNGHFLDGIIAAAMCGALIGFLRYNFPPATAYLGDSGSMVIGLMVAALAIRSASKQPTAYAFFAPMALLAIPMLDTLAAIIRRRLTGKSIYSTDRGHIHHELMRRGLSPKLALLWFSLLCATTVVGATLSLIYKQSEYAVVSIVAVTIFLVAGRVFGFAEFKLVSRKAMSLSRSFFVLNKRDKVNAPDDESIIQLQGNRNWDFAWQTIKEFVEKHEISELTMDLEFPWLGENFHATVRSNIKNGEEMEANDWFSEIPIEYQDRLAGRILVKANTDRCSAYQTIPLLIDVLDSLQSDLKKVIELQSQLDSSEILELDNSEDKTAVSNA